MSPVDWSILRITEKYELMEIKQFFKIKQNPEYLMEEYSRLQNKVESLVKDEKSLANLEMILDVFYEAYLIDSKKYILDVFFEFQVSKHKLKLHQDRIYEEMKRLDDFEPESAEEAIFLVNIYRNIVSDLFDSYISLIYASVQFREGKFDNYIVSNLGQGERNKIEYCTAKLDQNNLFDSYNSTVRNAISHSGTDGVTYSENEITFRSIRRGNPPRVESVSWSNLELQDHILGMVSLTQLIDYTVEIFNLDVFDHIKSDEVISHKYIDEVLTHGDRKDLQSPFDLRIEALLNDENAPLEEKLNILSKIYFVECEKRSLDVIRVGFHNDTSTAFVEVKGFIDVDIESQQDIYESVLSAIRYGIAAEPCFKSLIKKYVFLGEGEETRRLKVEAQSGIFSDYNDEKAGLLDLVTEVEASVGNVLLKVGVDFQKLKEIESNTLERKFPRRKR